MEIIRDSVTGKLESDKLVLKVLPKQLHITPQMFQLFDDISEISEQVDFKVLILDLSGVQHATSSFFAKLVALNETCMKKEARLRLSCLTGQVLDSMKILKLDTLIEVDDTQQDAMEDS